MLTHQYCSFSFLDRHFSPPKVGFSRWEILLYIWSSLIFEFWYLSINIVQCLTFIIWAFFFNQTYIRKRTLKWKPSTYTKILTQSPFSKSNITPFLLSNKHTLFPKTKCIHLTAKHTRKQPVSVLINIAQGVTMEEKGGFRFWFPSLLSVGDLYRKHASSLKKYKTLLHFHFLLPFPIEEIGMSTLLSWSDHVNYKVIYLVTIKKKSMQNGANHKQVLLSQNSTL